MLAPGAAFLLATLGSACGGEAVPSDPRSVLEAFDRMAAEPLWPGFDPRQTPLAFYDGRRTYLFRHPRPPEVFSRLRGTEGWWMEGRHPVMLASTVVELEGTPTAAVLADRMTAPSAEEVAAVLIHEAFHAYQDRRHPEWTAEELALFTYPVHGVGHLQARRLETAALRRSLLSPDERRRACWARGALRIRERRFRALPEEAVAYERGTELREGLALYVERRALRDMAAPTLPPDGFSPVEVRRRGYLVGRTLAYLLDDLGAGWQEALNRAGPAASLDGALNGALGGGRTCSPTRDEVARSRTVARNDSIRLENERARARRALVDAPGWQVVVTAPAEAPLVPRGFDPMNLEVLSAGEVIHRRILLLERGDGEVAIERPSLSRAAGEHPLFPGVREVVVTGIRGEPEAEVRGDTVRISADGIEAALNRARLEREGRTLRVILEP